MIRLLLCYLVARVEIIIAHRWHRCSQILSLFVCMDMGSGSRSQMAQMFTDIVPYCLHEYEFRKSLTDGTDVHRYRPFLSA